MRMRRIVACGLPALPYFSTLFHKWHGFRKKKIIGYKMYVFIFPTTLSETFVILSRNERDMIKIV